MKHIKDITISIFAIIGFVALLTSFTSHNEIQVAQEVVSGIPAHPNNDSAVRGCHLYGKIKIVEYGEDYKVKFVDYGEDLKIKYVDYGEDEQGKWKLVDYGENYKIKIVDYGEDYKVKDVDYGEGCN